jgi:hypothetical protein
VGVDNAMNFVEWIKLFVEQQIKSIKEDSVLRRIGCETIIQQDNTSTIQLENNGQASTHPAVRELATSILDTFTSQARSRMGVSGLYITQQKKWYLIT